MEIPEGPEFSRVRKHPNAFFCVTQLRPPLFTNQTEQKCLQEQSFCDIVFFIHSLVALETGRTVIIMFIVNMH